MGKNNKNNKAWSTEDRQRFADRNVLKAQTVQARRFQGPEAEEWEDLWEEIYS